MRRLMLMSALAALALPAAPALAQRATSGYTVRWTSMRAGPDFDYPAVQRIGRNARVDVYGCLRDRSWCDAGYRSDRGWVPGGDLVVDYRGRRSAVSSYPGLFVLTFIFGSYWDSHYRGRSFYAQRPRWEQQYYNNYKSHWGPRPQTPPAFRQPQPQPRIQPQPQPRPRVMEHHNSPTQILQVPARHGAMPGAAQTPANPSVVKVRHGNPAAQPTPAREHGRKKDKDKK